MPATGSDSLSVPVYQILLALSDRELHGYAILQEIKERTDGEVRLAAGTLYAAISRLEATGWIEELERAPDGDGGDSRRRYYRITAAGLEVVAAEAERLRRFARMAEDKRLIERLAQVPGDDG